MWTPPLFLRECQKCIYIKHFLHMMQRFSPCVFLIPKAREFFSFPFYSAIMRQKEILDTDRKLFLFAFLYNLLFYQFVILLICFSCTKAFIRVIIRELSDYFVVMTNWVLLCQAWWMGWIFLYSSGRQIQIFLTLRVLPWYVKSGLSMSKLWETISSLSSKEKT